MNFNRLNFEEWSLRKVLTVVISLCCFFALIFSAFLYSNTIFTEKKMDSYTIFNFQLEYQARGLNHFLFTSLRDAKKRTLIEGKEADIVFEWKNNTFEAISPLGLPSKKRSFFFNKDNKPLAAYQVVIIQGKMFLASYKVVPPTGTGKDRYYMHLWAVNFKQWLQKINSTDRDGELYLVDNVGNILYSSTPNLTISSLLSRPLVKKYLNSPLNYGQIPISMEDGSSGQGYFFRVPNSNIIMFYELPESIILGAVYFETFRNFSIGFLLILLAVVLVQVPLKQILAPLKYLTAFSEKIAAGNYRSRADTDFVGEVAVLAKAMNSLCENLNYRDQKIAKYVEEEKEFARRERELEFASVIQKSFIGTDHKSTKEIGEISTRYIPASEVAGDWFDFYCDTEKGETIAIVVDVMGHGVASALYTAIIAAVYRQFKIKHQGEFPLQEWFTTVNKLLCNLEGHYATAVGIKYKQGDSYVEVIGAGHPAPIRIGKRNDMLKVNLVKGMRSNPLGNDPESIYKLVRLEIEPFDTVLMYTDGLIEAVNPEEEQFGKKRLMSSLRKLNHNSPASIHQHILHALNGWERDDDLCLLAWQIKEINERKA